MGTFAFAFRAIGGIVLSTTVPTPSLRSALHTLIVLTVLAFALALLLVAVITLAFTLARAVRGIMASAAVPATTFRASALASECVSSAS